MSRITLRLKNPNSRFVDMILDLISIEFKNNNHELVEKYSNALESLQKFPLPLKNAKECFMLEGFDKELCVKLNKKLNENRTIKRKIIIACECTPTKVQKTAVKKSSPVRKITKKSPAKRRLLNEFKRFELEPGEFDVVLLVDTQETQGLVSLF